MIRAIVNATGVKARIKTGIASIELRCHIAYSRNAAKTEDGVPVSPRTMDVAGEGLTSHDYERK